MTEWVQQSAVKESYLSRL